MVCNVWADVGARSYYLRQSDSDESEMDMELHGMILIFQ